ncbi:hypothetical protein [Nonomuraea sp. B19D2]|uniref:hypothetical protein n=1 Tax=Nonomuraea sp. B19D2 TaxID=3159561 RepID=UPI0032DACDB9
MRIRNCLAVSSDMPAAISPVPPMGTATTRGPEPAMLPLLWTMCSRASHSGRGSAPTRLAAARAFLAVSGVRRRRISDRPA